MIKDIAMHFCFKTGATNSLCGFPGSPLLHNYVWHHRSTLRFSQSPSSGDLSFANSKVFFLTLRNQQLRISYVIYLSLRMTSTFLDFSHLRAFLEALGPRKSIKRSPECTSVTFNNSQEKTRM
jgi:hypothetical protein